MFITDQDQSVSARIAQGSNSYLKGSLSASDAWSGLERWTIRGLSYSGRVTQVDVMTAVIGILSSGWRNISDLASISPEGVSADRL